MRFGEKESVEPREGKDSVVSGSLWWGSWKPETRRTRRGTEENNRLILLHNFMRDHYELISMHLGEEQYCIYGSLNTKGGKVKRENFQTVGW